MCASRAQDEWRYVGALMDELNVAQPARVRQAQQADTERRRPRSPDRVCSRMSQSDGLGYSAAVTTPGRAELVWPDWRAGIGFAPGTSTPPPRGARAATDHDASGTEPLGLYSAAAMMRRRILQF